MELPELRESGHGAAPGPSDGDIRFSGSFVMYNYARVATLLSRFHQECTKGKLHCDASSLAPTDLYVRQYVLLPSFRILLSTSKVE